MPWSALGEDPCAPQRGNTVSPKCSWALENSTWACPRPQIPAFAGRSGLRLEGARRYPLAAIGHSAACRRALRLLVRVSGHRGGQLRSVVTDPGMTTLYPSAHQIPERLKSFVAGGSVVGDDAVGPFLIRQ